MEKLLIKKVDADAIIPTQPYEGDAGFDVHAVEEVTLAPSERKAIRTGLAMAVPFGYVALVWDKSGVGIKKGQKTLGGVIDAGYRGEVMIGVVNLDSEPFTFEKGDKVAQILLQKIEIPQIEEVEILEETERGERGFGSSGK